MNRKAKINAEIRKTLEQLDGQETLPADPYFYTRLRARLDSRNSQRRIISVVLKPALLTLLIIINVGTAAWYLNVPIVSESDSRTELIELLSDDFIGSDESSEFIIQ